MGERADAVALSIVQPGDERGVLACCGKSRPAVPASRPAPGWRGRSTLQPEVESAGVHLIDSLADLRAVLQRLAAEHQA